MRRDTSRVFSLDLQNPKAFAEREAAVYAKAVTLECVCVIEEVAEKSLACWNFDQIDKVRIRDGVQAAMEFANAYLMAVGEQGSGQMAAQSELGRVHDALLRVEAWWRSVCEHAKATDCHLGLSHNNVLSGHAELV